MKIALGFSRCPAVKASTLPYGVDLEPDKERRKERRCPINWPITIRTERGDIEARGRDVSAEGMSIVSDQLLYLNEVCWIRISPTNSPEMEFTVKVIWSDLYGIDDQDRVVAVGVCFAQVSKGDRQFFQDVVVSQLGKKA